MSRRPVLALLAILLATVAGGCDTDHQQDGGALHPRWHEMPLPVPAGPSGRLAVRDATSCAGRWFLVGAVVARGGASRPAAWTSDDAHTWRPMPIDPSTYYARRAVLTSVACRDGRIAAVGARSGGAHGNPRVTSWYQRADGTLVDMHADFELYGGPEAISVRHVAAGPSGWLIAGNRLSGAAVWVSADATDFRIVDDDPALRSDPPTRTAALDQVWDGAAWTVVGRVETPGRVSPTSIAWTSTDGEHWTRQPVPPATDGFADIERVVRDGAGGLVAVGLRDDRFGVWRRTDGRWTPGDSFGAWSTHGTGAPLVSGLVAHDHNLVATVSDDERFRVWGTSASGHWRPVAVPVSPRASGETHLGVAADEDTVLLLSDDGSTGRIWITDW